MRCDRCGNALDQYPDRDKWRCKTCGAVVVGAKELEAELGTLGAGLAEPIDTSRLAASTRICPTCATQMNQLAIDSYGSSEARVAAEKRGDAVADIVIERCPKDYTLWFDPGELGKIQKAVANSEINPVLVRMWERFFEAKV